MNPFNRIHILLLSIILIPAAVLRLHQLGAQSFWMDELLSLEASTGRGQTDQALPLATTIRPIRLTKLDSAPPAWKVWTTLEKDSHPPLYYLLLRFWRDAFGDSESAVRALSAATSLAAVALIYLVGQRLAGPSAGLCAAALMAISPLQILYAQEARNYAMLCATTLLAGWAYLRTEEHDSIARLILLAGALLIAMLTHYLAAPVLAGIAIYAAVRCRGKRRMRIAGAFIVAAVIYAVIWGPFLLAQRDSFRRNREGSMDVSANGSISRTLVRVAKEPLRQIGGKSIAISPASTIVAVGIALSLLGSLYSLRSNPTILLAVLWLIGPLLFLATVDILASDATLTFPRYTVACGPGLFLLLGGLVFAGPDSPSLRQFFSSSQRCFWSAVAIAAAIYAVVSVPLAYKPWKADWRALAAGLDQKIHPDDTLVLATNEPQTWWLGGAVLGITHYSAQPFPVMLLNRAATESEMKNVSQGWLILHGTGADASVILPGFSVIQVGSDPAIGRIYRIMSARR